MQSAHLAAAVAANRHANEPSPQSTQASVVAPADGTDATPADASGAGDSLFSTPANSRTGSLQPPDASPPPAAAVDAGDSFSLLDNASGWSSNGSVYTTPSPSPSPRPTGGALDRLGDLASSLYRLRPPDSSGAEEADDDATVVGSADDEFVPFDADAATDVGDEVGDAPAADPDDDATVETGLLRPQRRVVAPASRSCGATRLVELGYGMATGVTLGLVLGGAWHLYGGGAHPGAVADDWSRAPRGASAAATAGARALLARAPIAGQLAGLWGEVQGVATRVATGVRARLPSTPAPLVQGAASLHNALERLAEAAARNVPSA